jgi:hypothetical protein
MTNTGSVTVQVNASAPFSTLWVDDDDLTCGGNSPCYHTIQEAVAAAQPGDTIRVRAGTYQGPIIINKTLTLSGESKENVTIQTSDPYQIIPITVSGPVTVKLEHLSISGDKEHRFGTGIALHGQNPQVLINHVRFSHFAFGILMAVLGDTPPYFSQVFHGVKRASGANLGMETEERVWKPQRNNLHRVASHPLTSSAREIKLQPQQAAPTFNRNQIRQNSDYGIALYKTPCFPFIEPRLEFTGQVQGEANVLAGNQGGDLCPRDYALPPGFVKP